MTDPNLEIFDSKYPYLPSELNILKIQDIHFANLRPEDNVYFLFYCPETFILDGRNDVRFNITFFNTSRKTSISKNVTEFWNKEKDQWEEFSVRSIPPKSSIELVFDELSKRTILGIDPESWIRLVANITYVDTYGEEGFKDYPVTYNMSLFNLKTLRVEIHNLNNEHKKFNLYVKTYEPMAGAVRPGVLFLIITFVIVVLLFIVVVFIILYSSGITRQRDIG